MFSRAAIEYVNDVLIMLRMEERSQELLSGGLKAIRVDPAVPDPCA